jgi:hypothetical protein
MDKEIQEEISNFQQTFPSFRFKVIDKIGQGF